MQERDRIMTIPEASLNGEVEHVVYIKSDNGSVNGKASGLLEQGQNKKHVYVPTEIKRAGSLLREARARHCVLASDVADGIHFNGKRLPAAYINDFEAGMISNPDLDKIIRGAERYIDPEDASIREIKEFAQRREEEKKWMRTLSQEGMGLGKSMRYLRLSTGMSQVEFAKAACTHKHRLVRFESDQVPPSQQTLEQLMKVANLDPNGKPAHYLRLQAAGQTVIKVEDLQQYTLGDLIKYLRLQKGLPQGKLAKAIGYSSSTSISDIEVNKCSIKNAALDAFIDLFGFSKDSALAAVIRQKKRDPDEPIPSETLESLPLEGYLFEEHFQEIKPYSLSAIDRRLQLQLSKRRPLNKKLKFLREKNGFSTAAALATKAGMHRTTVERLEREEMLPENYTLAKIVKGMGYDIHHPFMWELLDFLEEDRAKELQR